MKFLSTADIPESIMDMNINIKTSTLQYWVLFYSEIVEEAKALNHLTVAVSFWKLLFTEFS